MIVVRIGKGHLTKFLGFFRENHENRKSVPEKLFKIFYLIFGYNVISIVIIMITIIIMTNKIIFTTILFYLPIKIFPCEILKF